MVERFDPNNFRHDLLRRMAQAEAPNRPQEPGSLAKCAEELKQWFDETAVARFCCRRGRSVGQLDGQNQEVGDVVGVSSASAEAVLPEAASGQSGADVGEGGGRPSASSASGGAADSSSSSGTTSVGPAAASEASSPAEAKSSSSAAEGDVAAPARPSPARGGTPTACPPPKKSGFPARAVCTHVRNAFAQLREDMKVMLFLAFPRGSPYLDSDVEQLFQWHYTRRWWLCFDSSTVALLLMLMWDVTINPSYRVTLVLLFYAAFAAGMLIRKVSLFAVSSTPRHRRLWHNMMLCAFLFGRCIVCQPVLVNLAAGSRPFKAFQVEAFSSVMGLCMTNLSMVFMQQMQTVDMLVFCVINSIVFVLWITIVVQMPLGDALHTAYVGSIVVTLVCVRQQRDLEDLERRSFDHELMHARGTLVRLSDQISRQAAPREFAMGMHLLGRSRRIEHLNL